MEKIDSEEDGDIMEHPTPTKQVVPITHESPQDETDHAGQHLGTDTETSPDRLRNSYNIPEHVLVQIQQYIPESKLISMSNLQSSPNFSIKKYHDAIYFGEISNNRREGLGVMRYENGRKYEGSWTTDLRGGRGFERYPNGNTYDGEFVHGKADGKGIYAWHNGEIYDGEWRNGLKHGDGVWKREDGEQYIGEWVNSKAEGYGVHIWKNGDRYEGEWKACLKHGNGTDLFGNGDIYIGQYKFGKPNGYGQYIWANGSSYVGEFKNGLKCGMGKWRKSKENASNQFEGQYINDKKEGYGVFRWSSGNCYRGQYKGDEREGIGEMRWTDGSVYIGQWGRGIQHGYGKMIFPNGLVKEGFFDNNVYKGPMPMEHIPPILMDRDFNITSLAPREEAPNVYRGASPGAQSMYTNQNPQGEPPNYNRTRGSTGTGNYSRGGQGHQLFYPQSIQNVYTPISREGGRYTGQPARNYGPMMNSPPNYKGGTETLLSSYKRLTRGGGGYGGHGGHGGHGGYGTQGQGTQGQGTHVTHATQGSQHTNQTYGTRGRSVPSNKYITEHRSQPRSRLKTKSGNTASTSARSFLSQQSSKFMNNNYYSDLNYSPLEGPSMRIIRKRRKSRGPLGGGSIHRKKQVWIPAGRVPDMGLVYSFKPKYFFHNQFKQCTQKGQKMLVVNF